MVLMNGLLTLTHDHVPHPLPVHPVEGVPLLEGVLQNLIAHLEAEENHDELTRGPRPLECGLVKACQIRLLHLNDSVWVEYLRVNELDPLLQVVRVVVLVLGIESEVVCLFHDHSLGQADSPSVCGHPGLLFSHVFDLVKLFVQVAYSQHVIHCLLSLDLALK